MVQTTKLNTVSTYLLRTDWDLGTHTLDILRAVAKALQDLERACPGLQGLHKAVESIPSPVVKHNSHRAYQIALRKLDRVSIDLFQVHSKMVVVCGLYEAGHAAERCGPYTAIWCPSHSRVCL